MNSKKQAPEEKPKKELCWCGYPKSFHLTPTKKEMKNPPDGKYIHPFKPKQEQEHNTVEPTAKNSECRGSSGIPDTGSNPASGADFFIDKETAELIKQDPNFIEFMKNKCKEGTEAKGIDKPIIPRGSEPTAERQNSGTMPAKFVPFRVICLNEPEGQSECRKDMKIDEHFYGDGDRNIEGYLCVCECGNGVFISKISLAPQPSETSVLTENDLIEIREEVGGTKHISDMVKEDKMMRLTEARVLEKKNAEIDALKQEALNALKNSTTDMAKIIGEKDNRIRELSEEINQLKEVEAQYKIKQDMWIKQRSELEQEVYEAREVLTDLGKDYQIMHKGFLDRGTILREAIPKMQDLIMREKMQQITDATLKSVKEMMAANDKCIKKNEQENAELKKRSGKF